MLSSDDEESDSVPPHCRPAVHTLVTMEDTVIQKAVIRQDDCDLQEMQVGRICLFVVQKFIHIHKNTVHEIFWRIQVVLCMCRL